jgi:hypothetical protein
VSGVADGKGLGLTGWVRENGARFSWGCLSGSRGVISLTVGNWDLGTANWELGAESRLLVGISFILFWGQGFDVLLGYWATDGHVGI